MYISSLDEIIHLLILYLSSTKPLLLFYFYSKVVTIIPTLGINTEPVVLWSEGNKIRLLTNKVPLWQNKVPLLLDKDRLFSL